MQHAVAATVERGDVRPMTYDVAIIGSGPAGASCAAFCAMAGLRVIVLEREKFPREKVCGDCLNPSVWPVLQRLGVAADIRELAQGRLNHVDFIGLSGRTIRVDLPSDLEIAVKRSLFDDVLMQRARALGAEIRESVTLTSLERATSNEWLLNGELHARFVVAADGRNSTVARLRGLIPRVAKERVALQAHLPLPHDFGNRVVLQLLPGGYSGQAPVNDHELNVCLVGVGADVSQLRLWAVDRFKASTEPAWRTITPLTRAAISPAHSNLLLVGDAARVIEPFTGEGIYYALRSGELAADAIRTGDVANYARQHAAMYRGRLWINRLARAAVVRPRIGSLLLDLARLQPALLRFLTRKIAAPP
jgi:geranylgeranyl reductase family protein